MTQSAEAAAEELSRTTQTGQGEKDTTAEPRGLHDLHQVARVRLDRCRGLIEGIEGKMLDVPAREAKDLAVTLQRLTFLERHLMRLVMGQEPEPAMLPSETTPALGSRAKSQAAALRGSTEE
jgi:hypothetical protein